MALVQSAHIGRYDARKKIRFRKIYVFGFESGFATGFEIGVEFLIKLDDSL